MSKIYSQTRICQTCRYWTGARNIITVGKLVEALSEEGKCVNTHGFFNQQVKAHAAGCSHHEPII